MATVALALHPPPLRPLFPTLGSVAYDELGTSGVSRVRIAKILRFGAPLFFANVAMLKVCAAYTPPPLPHPLAPCPELFIAAFPSLYIGLIP